MSNPTMRMINTISGLIRDGVVYNDISTHRSGKSTSRMNTRTVNFVYDNFGAKIVHLNKSLHADKKNRDILKKYFVGYQLDTPKKTDKNKLLVKRLKNNLTYN